jgi:hypothetical protein
MVSSHLRISRKRLRLNRSLPRRTLMRPRPPTNFEQASSCPLLNETSSQVGNFFYTDLSINSNPTCLLVKVCSCTVWLSYLRKSTCREDLADDLLKTIMPSYRTMGHESKREERKRLAAKIDVTEFMTPIFFLYFGSSFFF